jgi:hypothetical protein
MELADEVVQRGIIGYFNVVLAKPFRWTYAGKPLRAA